MKPKHFIAAAVIALIAAFLPACADGRQEFTDGYRVGHIVSYAPFGISYAAEIKSGSENAVMIGGNEALITGVGEVVLSSSDGERTQELRFTSKAAADQLVSSDIVMYVGESVVPTATSLPQKQAAECDVRVVKGECVRFDAGFLNAVKPGTGSLLLREKSGDRAVFVNVLVLEHAPGMEINASTLRPGEQRGLSAVFSDGVCRTVDFFVEYGENILTVNDNVATALREGKAIVSAFAEGQRYRFVLTVTDGGQQLPAFDVKDMALTEGEEKPVEITFENPDAEARIVYSVISGADVIEISDGRVKALKAGRAEVLCTDEISGNRAIFTVTVSAAEYKLAVDDMRLIAGKSAVIEPVLLPDRAGVRYSLEILSGEEYVAVSGIMINAIKPGVSTVRCRAESLGVYADFTVTVVFEGGDVPEGYVKVGEYLFATIAAGRYTSAQKLDFFTPLEGAEIYFNRDCEPVRDALDNAVLWTQPLYLVERKGELSDYTLMRQVDAALTWAGTSKDYSSSYVSQIQNGKRYRLINRAYVFNVAVVFDGEIVEQAVSSYIIWDNDDISDVPVISLSAPSELWFDGIPDGQGRSLYNNVYIPYTNTPNEITIRANLEFFDTDGTGFEINTQVKVGGGWSRGRPQRTLHLNFNKDEYGNKQTPVKHTIFGDRKKRGSGQTLDEFTRFRLWNGGSTYESYMRFNDAFLQLVAQDANVATAAARPAIVYLNGEFWGMYYLREHYSDVYFHYNYDVEKDNVQYFDYVGGSYDVSDGNEEEATAFINEMNAFLDNPANNFADDAVFDAFFSRYVDEQSFIDYFIIQSWCGNWDCVGNRNNHRLWRAASPEEGNAYTDGKLRFALHDLDMGMQNDLSLNGQYSNLLDASAPYSFMSYNMFARAMENAAFRQRFYNRAVQLTETSLSPENTLKTLDELAASVRGLIGYNITFWAQGSDQNAWENALDYGRSWLSRRNDIYLSKIAVTLGV